MKKQRHNANGEGTIYKRKDGRWEARVTLPDGRRKGFYHKDYAVVSQKLLDARSMSAKGLPIPGERLKVGQFLDDWLQEKQDGTKKVRPSTWTRYQDFVRLHIKPVVGNVALAHLTPAHVRSVYRAARKAGLTETTVHHLATVLHGALSFAMKEGLVARNVTELVDRPAIERKEMQTLSAAEVQQLLDYLHEQQHRLEALFILALWTGLRQGEALALRWRDIELDTGILHVNASLRYHHRQFDFQLPKNKKKRDIKLAPEVIAALHQHKGRQADERVQLGQHWQGEEKREDDLVFTNHYGGPMDASNLLKYHFYPTLKKAGVKRVRWHDLRHSYATLQLEANTNPKLVSTILGHSTTAITLDIYSHVRIDMQDAAIEAMHAPYARGPASLLPSSAVVTRGKKACRAGT